MIRLFLNGAAASAGGGLTYLRNVIPQLAQREDVHTTVAVNAAYRGQLPHPENIVFVEGVSGAGAGPRFLWEQSYLRSQIAATRADVLLAAGNFAIWKSPVPQVLLSGNSLYLSSEFSRDLLARREYGILAGHYLRRAFARRSIQWADCTVAPSRSFAEDLRKWIRKENIRAIHHGFDRETFFRDESPLPEDVKKKIDSHTHAIRLLFVSPYNYYRNFETLFRSLPLIRKKTGREIKLFLTCRLKPDENPGSYRVGPASALVKELGIAPDLVELGPISNHQLHQIYRACHIYVTASYAETFAHPLVEAMASALPVVASHLAVHREICGNAAAYFHCFSPEELAERVAKIACDPQRAAQMSKAALERSRDFSWKNHVEELLTLLHSVTHSPHAKAA